MGQIIRPLKTGGTRQYETEVAGGHTDIIDVEVDGDINTIYDEFNHRIDDSNIKDGANIAKAKLNLLNSIVNADVNTAAAIHHSKLDLAGLVFPGTGIAPHTIGPTQLWAPNGVSGAPGTASPAPFVTGVGCMTSGSAVRNLDQEGSSVTYNVPNDGAEHILAQTTWASQGGFWLAFARVAGYGANMGSGSIAQLFIRFLGGGTVGVLDGSVLDQSEQQLLNQQPTVDSPSFGITLLGIGAISNGVTKLTFKRGVTVGLIAEVVITEWKVATIEFG